MSTSGFVFIVVAFSCQVIGVDANTGQLPGTKDGKLSSKGRYPNLYFSAEDVPRLRNQAHSTHARFYERLSQAVRKIKVQSRERGGKTPPVSWEEFSAKWNEVYGNNLALLATYCVVTPSDHRARQLVKLYMERLASYPSWRVIDRFQDELPVAHTLQGFAIAFDFLHGSLTHDEHVRYLAKIYETAIMLYKMSLIKWWGRSYIHNHVTTNFVALLTAAIVVRPHLPEEATMWAETSIIALNNTLSYLQLVVDGSLQEGVSYGTYTMRSLIQFMVLTERHLGYSYRNNNWLNEHLNFLLHSILPGYQKTIGIADSIKDWAYAPEGVLIFLEDYVHRNGKAIWLANRIDKLRPARRMEGLLAIAHTSVDTEFLFYNEFAEENAPNHAKLHVFSDWGLITYGGGTPTGEVFLSFKCGRLHGRAINMLRPRLRRKVQNGFSPGHEQPDHGSFVFIAKEQAVITESFYAPKFTFLENVMVFGPSWKSSCTSPYEGQLGECFMWFNHGDKRTWQAHGELVGYSQHGETVFMSGDMTGWYDKALGLETVYRVLLMISPSVLVVVDTVRLRTSSSTTHVSTFFHNVDVPFEKTNNHAGSPCALVGRYSLCWANHNSQTVNVGVKNNFKVNGARYPTNFVSVTSRLLNALSSTAYVFHGPHDFLQGLTISQTAANGISVNLKINATNYDITLSTRHDNPRLRRALLGSNGYGKLSMNETTFINLGVKGRYDIFAPETNTFSFHATKAEEQLTAYPSGFLYTPLASLVILTGLFLQYKKLFRLYNRIRWTTFAMFCVWSLVIFAYVSAHRKLSTSTTPSSLIKKLPSNEQREEQLQLEAVITTGLPLNGAEIARELFTTNTDFLVVDVPSEHAVFPSEISLFEQRLDLCEWSSDQDVTEGFRAMSEWWKTLTRSPLLIRRNKNRNTDNISLNDPINPNRSYWIDVSKSPGALAMVHFHNPGWLFRFPWLSSKFLGNSLAPMLYLVRDPRSWIEHMLLEDSQIDAFSRDLESALRRDVPQGRCEFPSEILSFQEIYEAGGEPHVVLANIWVAFVSYATKLKAALPPNRFAIVRVEDLILSPKETSEGVYDFLRMPFTVAVEHRILQVTKSGIFKLANYGVINKELTTWGKILSEEQIVEIEKICKTAMMKIGYT